MTLLRRDRELRRLAFRPLRASLLAFIAVCVAVTLLLNSLFTRMAEAVGLDPGPVAGVLGFLGALAVSGVLFVGLASVVGSLFLDRLTRETEARITGTVPGQPAFGVQLGDTVKRLIFSLVMALLTLVAGFVVPVAGPILVAGYTTTVDATGGSFLRRGIGLGRQMGRVFQLPGMFGFLLIAGLLSLVPFLNVFALPLTMTAAAIMAAHGLGQKALDKPPRFMDTI
ncbi:hypothetical protein BH11ARM2_BH11ARM2_21710 [soil metagenome]